MLNLHIPQEFPEEQVRARRMFSVYIPQEASPNPRPHSSIPLSSYSHHRTHQHQNSEERLLKQEDRSMDSDGAVAEKSIYFRFFSNLALGAYPWKHTFSL